jgi:hypothetical protein
LDKNVAPPGPKGDSVKKFLFFMLLSLISLNIFFPGKPGAAEPSGGYAIYVPIYRSFYQIYGSTRDAYSLTSTVCLHNPDPKHAITVLGIDYFDSLGKLLNKFLDQPLTIKPWNSKEITIPPSTKSEDFGGNLIVRWKSDQPANPLIVEVLMTGQVLNRGVSFLTRGVEVKE